DELRERIEWFFAQHPDLFHRDAATTGERTLLSFVQPDRLRRVLARVFDQNEFLSPHGIRSVSRAHLDPPYSVNIHGVSLTERYEPAESVVPIYGGNSNWRGPVWFPLNFLFIDTLRTYHAYLGDAFTIEYPSGSGNQLTLEQIARDLSQRLVSIFETRDGRRPVYGGAQLFQQDPHWKDLVLFYEYFHGDNGAGIGASHQTGWTGLIAELLRSAEGASQQVPVVRGLPQAAE
ncbi:MAG TPA: glucosidase, partial [Polyangiaceae bacterium]|nr:glucosidase [Polyangiaceae bacterium]